MREHFMPGLVKKISSKPIVMIALILLQSAPVAAQRVGASEAGAGPIVLDVRTPQERAAKRLEGSISVPLNHLTERVSELSGMVAIVIC